MCSNIIIAWETSAVYAHKRFRLKYFIERYKGTSNKWILEHCFHFICTNINSVHWKFIASAMRTHNIYVNIRFLSVSLVAGENNRSCESNNRDGWDGKSKQSSQISNLRRAFSISFMQSSKTTTFFLFFVRLSFEQCTQVRTANAINHNYDNMQHTQCKLSVFIANLLQLHSTSGEKTKRNINIETSTPLLQRSAYVLANATHSFIFNDKVLPVSDIMHNSNGISIGCFRYWKRWNYWEAGINIDCSYNSFVIVNDRSNSCLPNWLNAIIW